MRNSLWGYLVAGVVACIWLFLKDAIPQSEWLGLLLLSFAVVAAMLATLNLVRGSELMNRMAAWRRSARAQERASDRRTPSTVAERVQVPRPAGPVGPAPVLQKKPKNETGDALGVGSKNPAGSAPAPREID